MSSVELAVRLTKRIVDHCDAVPLGTLGFPGPCTDPDASDGFTPGDLAACIAASHSAASASILPSLYDPALVSPLRYADFNCQKTVGKKAAGFARALLGAVQKCRLGIVRGTILDVRPERCAIDHPATAKIIAKAERTLRHLVDGRCSDAQADRLLLCSPNQPIVTGAVDCLIDTIVRLVDNLDPTAPSDLIDYEFAGTLPAFCGNDRVDAPGEECDGTGDAVCPGACGAATGLFPCLCQDIPRQRVIEHFDADYDLGWTGSMHDQHVAEGGGYLTDLWDCDGAGGPDTRCAVGPSCSLTPHSPCSPSPTDLVTGNSICAALGQGVCRKSAGGATGPHCLLDIQRRCTTNAQCLAVGDRCVKTVSGPPLPMSAGGVSACLVRIFSEDVVGTTDLATGESDVRLRQRAFTYIGGSLSEPCPVCGGFCAAPGSFDAPGSRTPCATDADCGNPPSLCVTDAVCSYGANVDAPCRPGLPFGGPTDGFGTTSVDCLPPSSRNVSGSGIDLLESPRRTGTVTFEANTSCTAPGFSGNACIGGASDGRSCVADADCPGGVCRPQCFCAGQVRPNACDPACVGGVNDAAPCSNDDDCGGGFCHPGDCRIDPSDVDSCQEGRCTVGPMTGSCSLTSFVPCSTDAHCTSPACPQCAAGETCVFELRQCFVNGEIDRCGTPGAPDRTSASFSCTARSESGGVDAHFGLPGPAALTQPETSVVVGF
ncbi:MAG: hypothetical protein ABIR79_10630 [Candidatus Binatia bacterium]